MGMTGDLNDMVFAISNWSDGTTVDWLQKGVCYNQCTNPTMVYRNISITTGSSGPSPPTPGNYSYGDACGSKSDDYCDGSCDCRWSWPTDDPAQWAS